MSGSLVTRGPAAAGMGAALGLALLAVAACGSTTISGSGPATAAADTAGTAGTAGTAAGPVLTTHSGSAGTFLADGQGSDSFGAKWWLVTPAGSAITGGTAASTAASTPASGGY